MNNQQSNEYTVQVPIPSGFGILTTAREALGKHDLRGKVAIVTGGYSGIGTETTRVLAEAGATVIVPARSIKKAKEILMGIPNIEFEMLDLMDPNSIDDFSGRFLSSNRPLHILINGAGVISTSLKLDSRGYESQFSTNYLGHFQLTARLWPALKLSKGARVVVLSSFAHKNGGVDFDDPNFKCRQYDKWKAYAQSKSASALFVVALDKRSKFQDIRAFAVHPGIIPDTNLGRDLGDDEKPALLKKDANGQIIVNENDEYYKTVEQGAATTIWCATSEQLEGMGGVYCEDVDIAQAVSADCLLPSGVRPWAIDKDMAEQLWQLGEKLTGVKFPF